MGDIVPLNLPEGQGFCIEQAESSSKESPEILAKMQTAKDAESGNVPVDPD